MIFFKEVLEESLVVVDIIVTTFHGYSYGFNIIDHYLSRSLHSRRMFVIVKGWRLLDFEMVEVMGVAFGLLVVWCLEWIVVGSKQVECWVVSIVVEYWLKDNVGLFVVDNNG